MSVGGVMFRIAAAIMKNPRMPAWLRVRACAWILAKGYPGR